MMNRGVLRSVQMPDFADKAAQAADLYLDWAIRHHANRCTKPAPIPVCCWCEDAPVEVFASGAKSRYCVECKEDATQ